jgi:hypothetical protein
MRALHLTRFFCFASLAFAVLCPTAAFAVPVCTTASLSTYLGLDTTGGCTIGDFTFFRFTAPTPTTTGSPTVASNSQIYITPIVTASGAGLSFSATDGENNLFAISSPSGTTAVTYFIDYSVDPAPIILGSDLDIDPPYGNVSVTQTYCTADVLVDGCALGTESQQTVANPSPLSSVISFTNPSSFVDIATSITLSATPGDPAGLDSVNAAVSNSAGGEVGPGGAVPEPSMLPLMPFLLLPLVFLMRRKRA